MNSQNLELSLAFSKVNALTQEQRDKAYDDARKRIVGQKPTRADEPKIEDFERNAFRKFPPELLRFMHILFYVILIAAFLPSSIRIFLAMFEQSVLHIQAMEVGILVALMAVLLAETGQIAFTLWASLTQKLHEQIPLYLAAVFCTAFALIGNEHIVKPFDHPSLLSFLDAFLPPILVLIAANVRKGEILYASKERFRINQEYKDALKTWKTQHHDAVENWKTQMENAHTSPAWERTLANCLRDAIRNANKVSKQILRELTMQDWYGLILRERKSEEWWDNALTERNAMERKTQLNAATQIPIRSGNSTGYTGEVVEAETREIDGGFVKVCPICQREFMGEDMRTATNKLVAHMKRHSNERKAIALNGNAELIKEDA